MVASGLSLFGTPRAAAPAITAKAALGIPPVGFRVAEFDTWKAGYAGYTVEVVQAGTTMAAPLFADPALTQPIPNPQTLGSLTDENGATYGKWQAPVYTFVPYFLVINNSDVTGVEQPPLTTLAGEDASLAIATSKRGGYGLTIQDWLDRSVDATLYGALGDSNGSAGNTQTINDAIGAAAAQGGGEVLLPAGPIPFTTLNLPEGVVLRGAGIGATTLQSDQTGIIVTLSGDGSGLRDLTLDGIDVVPNSFGVAGTNVAAPVFQNALVKRFDTGVSFKGVTAALWRDFSVSNCGTGVDLRGDADASSTQAGGPVQQNIWQGGSVSTCTKDGILLRFVDQLVRETTIEGVGLYSNAGNAVRVHGARGTRMLACDWGGNLNNLTVEDDTNTSLADLNTVERLTIEGGAMQDGALNFNGACEDVILRSVDLQNVSYNLSIPTAPVILIDCIEDAQATAQGDTTKLLRQSTGSHGVIAGITTDATPLTAWQYNLAPGQVILVSAKVIARQRDGTDAGIFWPQVGAYCAFALLPVFNISAAFTAGKIVTGKTSGASARIGAVDVTGGSGTLSLRDIVGTFITGELLTDSADGAGQISGPMTTGPASFDGTGASYLRAPWATNIGTFGATFDTFGNSIRLRLTGAAGKIVEWTASLDFAVP